MTDRPEEASTRSRMLDAALRLFAENGFAGTSMRMLARETGLRESSFYNHFASKDELYQAVIGQWGPMEFVQRLKSEEYRALSDQPAAFFRLCGKHLADRWMDPRDRLFMALINTEGSGGPAQKRYYDALFREEIELLADYCAQFKAAHGLFAPDPKETARMFVAGLTLIRRELLMTSTAEPSRAAVDAAVSAYIENYIATVLR
ncbi:MAG: TetR/AcrR family transcriptional regulator [Pseudomonadota bacterium]